MSRFIGLRGAAAVSRCLVATAAVWLMLAGVAKAAGPTNTGLPVISGTPVVGQMLAATTGTWTGTGTITYAYQWASGGTSVGANSPNYTVTATDVGKAITVTVTATDSTGSTPATSASTIVTGPPQDTSPPTIAGTAQAGQTLAAGTGTWTGTAPITYAYKWASGGIAVGTNSPSYTVAATDIGKTITVTITASNAAGAGPPAISAPTAVVLPAAPVNVVPPTISGTAQQGQILSLTPGRWNNTPTSITDQWATCLGLICSPIPGQTGASYILGPGDVGHTIEVVETATNMGVIPPAVPPTATSAPTAVVTATSFTSVVAFFAAAPTTNQMVTLVATVSSSSGNAAPSGSLSFLDGANGIPGCTGKPVRGGLAVTVVCQASFPAGTAQISAAYAPGLGSIVDGSASSPDTIVIGRGPMSVSLAVTKQLSPGSRAIYSATLVPGSNSGPIRPTGSIEFLDQGQPISGCPSQPLSNLTATCTVQYPSPGTHDITAAYSGDPNFSGATSPSSSVQVVAGSTAPRVLGLVRSTLEWSFFYHPTYTQVLLLKAFQIARGTTVSVTCRGGGCPFKRMHHARKRSDSINLLPAFIHRNLRAGSKITIRLTHPQWLGKYYSFTIRAGHPPLIHEACLAVGGTVPGSGC